MSELAASLAGLLIAVPALFLTAAIARLVRQGKNEQRVIAALAQLIAILFGSPVVGTFIGARVTSDVLWPWFVVGEAVLFVPGAALVAYRELLRP